MDMATTNLGQMIDKLKDLDTKYKAAQKKADEAEKDLKEHRAMLMERLAQEGMRKATGKKATFSVTPSVKASVKDWDVFWAMLIKKKATHLVERRVSSKAIQELFEQEFGITLDEEGHLTGLKKLPDLLKKWGLEPFVVQTPHLTALK